MMPKPNNSKEKNYDRKESTMRTMEKTLFETKPNILLYADNFILKFIVLFFLVFMFNPILAIVYNIQGNLQYIYRLDISNITSIVELILIFCILIVIIKIALDYLDWKNTSYVLTDKRIIINRGLFNRESISMSYAKIQDIDLSQSIIERLLGAGDIIVYGGHDNSETILDEVPQPKEVEEIILDNINKLPNYGTSSLYNQHYPPTYPNQQYPNSQYSDNQQYSNGQYPYNQQYPNNSQENQDYYNDTDFNQNNQYSQKHHENNNTNTHYYSNDNYDENIKQNYNQDNPTKEHRKTKIDNDELVNRNLRKFKKSK